MKLPSHNKLNTYIPLSSDKALMIPSLTASSIKKSNFSLREQKAQTEIHKIHKTHYQSTNSITKHRSNQIYSIIEPAINKEFKITKEIKKTKQPKKRDVEKKKNKIESQPTPASNWLSQAQQWEKENLLDVTCRPYSNLNHFLHN